MKIRHWIMLWVAVAGLVTSLVFSMVVFWELREQPLEMIDLQLKAVAISVAGQLPSTPKPSVGELDIMLPMPSERYWVKAYDQNGHIVYQSALSRVVNLPLYQGKGEGAFTVSARVLGKEVGLHEDDEDEVAFRVRTIDGKIAGAPYMVQIARPMKDLEDETFDLMGTIGIGLSASTILLLGLSYVFAGRIVEPIAAINRLARDINENTLENRIPLGDSHDEIQELAACLNQMFDRLQFSFARQKRFLADASHELKSPIAMLRLFFDEAIQRGDLPETFHRQLDNQGRNVLRLDRLVRTLLELSVLEIRPTLEMKPFNIAELACSVAADFSQLMEREGIRLETEMPEQLEIWGDQDKIRRALINIFDNAVKYNMEKGLIRFNVAENKDRIHVSLYNTGPGIPKEDLTRVFDQFHRVDKSRSTKHGGAGLGLTIAREIVRLHKGSVSIDSRQGLWTRVDIFLPQRHEENRSKGLPSG